MNKRRNFKYASFRAAKDAHIMDALSSRNLTSRKVIKTCDQIPVSDGFSSYFDPAEVNYAGRSPHHAGVEGLLEENVEK